MRSTYSMHGSMADYSQERTIICLNVISISKGLDLFLIYAPVQHISFFFIHLVDSYMGTTIQQTIFQPNNGPHTATHAQNN
jgi:hypothetical protein